MRRKLTAPYLEQIATSSPYLHRNAKVLSAIAAAVLRGTARSRRAASSGFGALRRTCAILHAPKPCKHSQQSRRPRNGRRGFPAPQNPEPHLFALLHKAQRHSFCVVLAVLAVLPAIQAPLVGIPAVVVPGINRADEVKARRTPSQLPAASQAGNGHSFRELDLGHALSPFHGSWPRCFPRWECITGHRTRQLGRRRAPPPSAACCWLPGLIRRCALYTR